MHILLIRHGLTLGNQKKVYLGMTDEPLLEESFPILQKRREQLKAKQMHNPQQVYTSPMRRCLETAQILFPRHLPMVMDRLKECNFGDFEYQTYEELSPKPEYQQWLLTEGRMPFPNGEGREEFSQRVLVGFSEVLQDAKERGQEQIAIVTHGGCIMAIMERYASIQKDFYHWQIGVDEGYSIELSADFAIEQRFIQETKL